MYKEIIINTFDFIFKNSNQLIKKLILPIILISIINYFIPQFSNPKILKLDINSLDINSLLIPLLLAFSLIMLNISIAITTYRIAILGEDSLPSFGSYLFGLREFKFLFKTILIGIIILIPTLLAIFIPFVGPYISIFISLLLISRLVLVFPSISCDEPMSFYESWKLTKNHTFLSLFAVIIFPIIFSLTVGVIYTLAIEFMIKLMSSHFWFLYSILNVFITVFSISALSSLFIYLKPTSLNKFKKDEPNPIRDIIEKQKKDLFKIIIHDKQKVNFNILKKELVEQYTKLHFTDIAYDRKNAWILKNITNEEAYVSLRYDNDEFTITTNKTVKPELNFLNKK